LTAPEIVLLRTIHGDDCITEIKPREDIKRNQVEERARLEMIYKPKFLAQAFGHPNSPLPSQINTDDPVAAE
jgi:hypothetical protein